MRFAEFKRRYEMDGKQYVVLGGRGETEFTGCGATGIEAHIAAEAKIDACTPDWNPNITQLSEGQ